MLFRLSWQFLRQRGWEILAIIVLQIAGTLASLQLPDINARIIDDGVSAGNTGIIWTLGLHMLGLTFVQGVFTALAIFLAARLCMSLGATLRERVFTHVHDFSAEDIHNFTAASLITRSTNDVQQIQFTLMVVLDFAIMAPIMAIGGVIQAVNQDVQLSWILLIIVPAMVAVIAYALMRLAPLFEEQQTRIDNMNTVLREELTGIRVIRAFVRGPFIRRRYTDANDHLRRVALSIGTWFAFIFPAVTIVISLGTVAIEWFGAMRINQGSMEIGGLTAFITYVAMISQAVTMGSFIFIMVPRANVSSRRVHEVISHVSTVARPERPVTQPEGRWTFALTDVTVQYPGAEEPVLHDINLELRPGTITGLIGSTASGKSTLVNLFPRLMDPTSGTVTAGGVSTQDLDLTDLRHHMAVVPQKAYLFSGTIASTVSGVTDPDEAQRARVQWALDGAQATEFVSSLDEGIDAEVEPGGSNFSGGQRQRLSIARALYRMADLYIFDDSFSALDYATDARLRASLPQYTEGAAVMIVAQRVATIRYADVIAVLEHGRIIDRGTHSELMQRCTTYQEIVHSQMTEEEAAS